jgi:hypothetical protein
LAPSAAAPGVRVGLHDKVRIAQAIEDLTGVSRVDRGVLPEADPFLAANLVRGERTFAADPHSADAYDLFILRRAGGLGPQERERHALLLGQTPWRQGSSPRTLSGA